ncbi:hypothetical protein L3X38_025239 [Prunus dulcis]|uniref:Uncharacterized protein n=1 Tax=Prunus dulcis TaxID=3755 RepID=A0AAD4Z756_PRUDU|nr:hypothetical protein L3X38_025239 [Prunus dulcis]
MQQGTTDIDEQVKQLQERKVAIVAKVSEIVQSKRPLEAQLQQDAATLGVYQERKLMLLSEISQWRALGLPSAPYSLMHRFILGHWLAHFVLS